MVSYYRLDAPRVELGPMHLDADDLRASTVSGVKYPPVAVHRDSPLRVRRVVEKLARCFKGEMASDGLLYHADERTDSRDRHYLFPADGGMYDPDADGPEDTVVGAAGFRWSGGGPVLVWCWFHPFARGRGHLSRAWPFFKVRFKDFQLQPPLSPAMWLFLRLRDPEMLRNVEPLVAGS
jgi:hypothetical protein